MRSIIIYKSIHHQNTEKVAREMAQAIGAECKEVSQADPMEIAGCDLIGFGSGIYFSSHHKELLAFVTRIQSLKGKAVFVFSTSGFEELVFHETLKERIEERGGRIVGEFKCGGWHTYGPFKMDGGLQQGRPDRMDLQNAADFARSVAAALR